MHRKTGKRTKAAVINELGNAIYANAQKVQHIAASRLVLLYQPITTRCYFSIHLENIRKPKGFLMFSEGIEKQHRTEMG